MSAAAQGQQLQTGPRTYEKREKTEKGEKGEKQEKRGGVGGALVGGSVLIWLGVTFYLERIGQLALDIW